MTGQPNNTIKIPPTKKLVAFNLCLWKKNLNVRSSPITHANPQIKRIWKNKYNEWLCFFSTILYYLVHESMYLSIHVQNLVKLDLH